MYYSVSRKQLDNLVFKLLDKGFYVSRHSYSYRLFYRGKLVAGIHVYPGYNEVSLRLYRVYSDVVREVADTILSIVKEVFKDYRVEVSWFPPENR